MFGSQFERVLPESSVANMYPLNYSGKTDKNGFYLGRDKYGKQRSGGLRQAYRGQDQQQYF